MRQHVGAAALTFAFAFVRLAGEVREAGAVADEQANCAGENLSTAATIDDQAVNALNSSLAEGASTDCDPDQPEKGAPIGTQ